MYRIYIFTEFNNVGHLLLAWNVVLGCSGACLKLMISTSLIWLHQSWHHSENPPTPVVGKLELWTELCARCHRTNICKFWGTMPWNGVLLALWAWSLECNPWAEAGAKQEMSHMSFMLCTPQVWHAGFAYQTSVLVYHLRRVDCVFEEWGQWFDAGGETWQTWQTFETFAEITAAAGKSIMLWKQLRTILQDCASS